LRREEESETLFASSLRFSESDVRTLASSGGSNRRSGLGSANLRTQECHAAQESRGSAGISALRQLSGEESVGLPTSISVQRRFLTPNAKRETRRTPCWRVLRFAFCVLHAGSRHRRCQGS